MEKMIYRKIYPVIFSVSSRVSVNSCFESHITRHSVSRTFIIKSFFFAGCVFPAEQKRTTWFCLDISIFEHIATLVLVIYIIGHIWNSYCRSASDLPIGLIFSYILGDLFTLLMRFILFRKRKLILETMEYLQNVPGSFEPRGCFNRRSWMVVGFAACFLIPIAFITLITRRLCSKDSKSLLPEFVKDAYYGWESGSDGINCVLLVTLDILISDQEYVLPGFLIVLSCYIFDLLQEIIRSFVIISDEDDVESLFLEYSQKIFLCMERVEESLSLLLLVLYGSMIFNIFNVTTYLFWADLFVVEAEFLTPQIILAVVLIIDFYVAGFQAVAVNSEAVRVKNDIHEMVARLKTPERIVRWNMLLLMVDDFTSRVCVSGWGIFQFKVKFISQTASAMITFGLIFSQLGK